MTVADPSRARPDGADGRRPASRELRPPKVLDGLDRFATFALLVAAAGFLSMHRFFAHLGSADLGISPGELLLVVAVVLPGPRSALTGAVSRLLQPGPLHAVVLAGVLFVAFGVFSTARGLDAGYGIEALKVFPYHYYAVVLLLGLWIGQNDDRILARFIRAFAWFNGLYAVAFVLVLDSRGIVAPGTDTPLILGTGSAIAITGLLCTVRPIGSVWHLYLLNAMAMFVAQGRAEWVALLVALGVWGLLERRLRLVAAGLGIVVALLLVASVVDVTIPTASSRGGSVSLSEISGRLIAPFDVDTARLLTDEADNFAGTAEWRSRWWQEIWEETQQSDTTLLIGFGAGYPLADVTNFVTDDVRSPHNILVFAVGYEGLIGLGLFVLFQGAILLALWKVRQRTGQIVGIVWWALLLTMSMFSVWYDSPIGSFPSYLLLGMALAPLVAGEQYVAPAPATRQPSPRWTR